MIIIRGGTWPGQQTRSSVDKTPSCYAQGWILAVKTVCSVLATIDPSAQSMVLKQYFLTNYRDSTDKEKSLSKIYLFPIFDCLGLNWVSKIS